MKINYTEVETKFGTVIQAEYDNNIVSFIPTDPANSDYQAYLASLENGTIS